MAEICPLFLADLDDLKGELRLTGIRPETDSQRVLERAVLAFSVEFGHRAGFDAITEIQAITFSKQVTTPDQLRRAAARLLEVKSVWLFMILNGPVLIGDASAASLQVYNDEGVWRQIDEDERRRMAQQCQVDIEDLYEIVLQLEQEGEDSDLEIFDGTAEYPNNYFPAGTVFSHIGKFRGNFVIPAIRFSDDLRE